MAIRRNGNDGHLGSDALEPIRGDSGATNTGDETLTFLELFRSDHFADISLNQWMALTPPELVEAHLNLDRETIEALSKTKPVIVR